MNSIREPSSLTKVGRRSLTPQDVRVRRVTHASRYRRLHTRLDSVETLRGSLTGGIGQVPRIRVARQEFGAHGICSRDEIRWDSHYIGSKPGSDQSLDRLVSGNQDFSP